MEFIKNKNFQFILRLVIGGLFIFASVDKIFDPTEFAKVIKNYDFLPISLVNFPAIIIPYLEFFTGLFLIIGLWKRGSSALIIIMLVFFLIGLGQAYARGLDINCGCFSLENSSSTSDILVRMIEDILMLIAAVLIFIGSAVNKTKTNEIQNERINQQ
ncbi:MAG: DoxX family membrane protein [Ignavibacteria bacterium]|nr:DoxX family membrane protein [Ignavibacteria bacterium]